LSFFLAGKGIRSKFGRKSGPNTGWQGVCGFVFGGEFLPASQPEDVLAILPGMQESERRAIGGRARERVLAAREGCSDKYRYFWATGGPKCNICVTKGLRE
jgi:hypothetical protein